MTLEIGPLELQTDDWFESWEFTTGVESDSSDPLEGTPDATVRSTTPATLSADVVTREVTGPMRAAELQALLASKSMQPVAVASPGFDDDGYYVATGQTRRRDISSDADQEGGSVRVPIDLARAGTQKSVWLATATHPTQPDPGHDFGNDDTAYIGIPAAASKVQAIDAAIGPSERAYPEPIATYPSEFGGVEVYDALEIGFDDPIFLYDLAYEDAAQTDMLVFDTLGYDEKHAVDEWGEQQHRQWQHVFNPAHDPVDDLVLDNGLLRVRLDEQNRTVTAEGFDDGSYGSGPYGAGPYGGYEDLDDADVWHDVTLPATEWSLLDVDLTHLSPVRAEAQLEFEHDTEGVCAVDVHLDRGLPLLRMWAPETVTDPIPSGIADLFDPIASSSTWDPGLRRTLIPREEVRF